MVKVKEMPYNEKYAKVIDNMKFDHAFIEHFVNNRWGQTFILGVSSSGQLV